MVTADTITCSTCNDTHRMTLRDQVVACTRCPLPCRACAGTAGSAFCRNTPCPCGCHAPNAVNETTITAVQIAALSDERGDERIPRQSYGYPTRANNGATIRDLCMTALGHVHPYNIREARARCAEILNARAKEAK